MRLLLPGPLLLLCAACATLRSRDVADAFAADAALLVDRVPSKADPDPARAANAPDVMRETERTARAFLSKRDDGSARASYAKALLACSLLAQGQPLEARDTLRGLKARTEADLSHENTVTSCAIHATSLCRSIQARTAAEALLAGKLPAAEFVRAYGSFANLAVGDPGSPEHEKMVQLAAANLEATCAPGAAAPGPAATKARADLMRLVSEQVYNDVASLLARIPRPPEGPRPADDIWLARVAVKGAIVYRYLIPDMLPSPLSPEQRAWQREQALPVFTKARSVAGWFLTQEARTRIEETRTGNTPDEILYDRLLSAQLEVLAWIDSR